MVTKEELEGFRRDRYLARSWALLTGDSGWIKIIILLALANLVPVVGWMGVLGYIYEWARRTAWNVNASPKQHGVKVGKCIKSGARVFLILLVWDVVIWAVGEVLSWIPLLGGLLAFVWAIFGLFLSVIAMVAALRATIYEKLGVGFGVSKAVEMWKHDGNGIARIVGLTLFGDAVAGVVVSVIGVSALFGIIPDLFELFEYSYYLSESDIIFEIFDLVFSMWPALIVVAIAESVVSVIFLLLTVTSVALWMRQFNVPAWGREDDPLPPTIDDPRDVGKEYYRHNAHEEPSSTSGGTKKSERPSQPEEVPASVVREWTVEDETQTEEPEPTYTVDDSSESNENAPHE